MTELFQNTFERHEKHEQVCLMRLPIGDTSRIILPDYKRSSSPNIVSANILVNILTNLL